MRQKFAFLCVARAALRLILIYLVINSGAVQAAQTEIPGPTGSGQFGNTIVVLPNGNIIIVDTTYDEGGVTDIGAVHLYNGADLSLISTLRGATATDNVGSGGITVLTNGNYVVSSPNWDNGAAATDAGAVTWCSGTTGCDGAVSAVNSLVGSTANDGAANSVFPLPNSNYVVRSVNWDNGAVIDAGAVTWGNGAGGTVGTVSPANSLVGTTASDVLGNVGVQVLTNGNYVIISSAWDNGAVADVGAVTWGNGTGGINGVVSSSNSLVGSTFDDRIGNVGVTALTNGNYVLSSSLWNNGAVADVGAVTWGNGTGGTVGAVSSSNSLVGTTASDQIGNAITVLPNGNYVVISTVWDNGAVMNAGAVTWGNGTGGTNGAVSSSNSLVGTTAGDGVGAVTVLTNGNYVVRSNNWDNGAVVDAGAVTWGNGAGGTVGAVSASNSLVGSTISDRISNVGVTALTNGNYVVSSSLWNNGAVADVGAVTWGNGAGGTVGAVSAANSLVGTTASDQIGSSGFTALTNGNYVVRSSLWDNGAITNAGAVTWGNGAGGTVGAVSSSNSLVGTTASDLVGNFPTTALTNGNYVVRSNNWDNGAVVDAGAVTWGNGAGGTVGAVSAANSLVGSTFGDMIGSNGITALTNGNYVVGSTSWNNGAVADPGAITWGNGTGGTVGTISASNSLIGSTADDRIGVGGFTALTNGNYIVRSPQWDNGAVVNAGAVTYGRGTGGAVGVISSANSVLGTVANEISTVVYDPVRNRVLVGRALSNTVSILFFQTTAATNGNFSNPATWSNGVPDALTTAVVPAGRTVTLDGVAAVGLVSVACGGSLVGASSTAYLLETVRKDFCAATNETFTFPVGTNNGYSPVEVSASGSGGLNVTTIERAHPTRNSAIALRRYWVLAGNGVTANLTFNYLDADIPAGTTEVNYRLLRIAPPVTERIDQAAFVPGSNKITAGNISRFSDWTMEQVGPPTAAGVSLAGRVMAASGAGRGIGRALIILVNSAGEERTAISNVFGYYRIENVPAGETYVLSVSHKRYQFAVQAVEVTGEMENLEITALP